MSQRPDGWIARVRRWLWLDRTQRTDDSEANRHDASDASGSWPPASAITAPGPGT